MSKKFAARGSRPSPRPIESLSPSQPLPLATWPLAAPTGDGFRLQPATSNRVVFDEYVLF